jgi:hypothetical protein
VYAGYGDTLIELEENVSGIYMSGGFVDGWD